MSECRTRLRAVETTGIPPAGPRVGGKVGQNRSSVPYTGGVPPDPGRGGGKMRLP